MSPFPWTYDQLQRYAVLRLLAAEWGRDAGPEGLRILDVGGAAADRAGTGFRFPAREILADFSASHPVSVEVVDNCGLGEKGSFDIVSACDVLEHVPKADRDAFLVEISRVASRGVLLCCPTKSPGVEQAEALLDAEIIRQYEMEHGELAEHREHGLPRPEEIEAGMARAGLTAVSFGYGALSTWLTYRVFRGSFLFRRESGPVTEAIDRYWAEQPQAAELEAPFYRRFWIGSKTVGRDELERAAESIKNQLALGLEPVLEAIGCPEREDGAPEPPSDKFDLVEQTTRRVLSRPFVSALVVTNGEPPLLGPCLDALLSQIVDFDYEVAVWNLNDRPATTAWLNAQYPQVRQFKGEFPGQVEALRGDRIFLLDEKFQPAPDAVARYVARTDAAPTDSVLAVSAPWRGGFPESWTGRARNSWKKSKGLMVKAGVIGNTSQMREDEALVPKGKSWVIDDGLFFRRIALFARKNSAAPDRNSVFLWEYK